MSDDTLLAQEFEKQRPYLHSVAYRMLGTTGEADDAVQEAWLRLSRTDSDKVENLRAWLTTVVGRVSLDLLRARKARRESPDDHLEPIISEVPEEDPAQEAEIADSVGLAMLVVLEQLSPPERVAFVLHDMFGVPFDEIAAITGRAPDAARQLASRARRRVRGSVPPSETDSAEQRRVIDAFQAAARAGDFEALLEVLDPDVVFRVHAREGDPRVEGLAAEGAEQVAERILSRSRAFTPFVRPAIVNGEAGTVAVRDGKRLGAMACSVRNGRIVTMDLVVDPERFQRSEE